MSTDEDENISNQYLGKETGTLTVVHLYHLKNYPISWLGTFNWNLHPLI